VELVVVQLIGLCNITTSGGGRERTSPFKRRRSPGITFRLPGLLNTRYEPSTNSSTLPALIVRVACCLSRWPQHACTACTTVKRSLMSQSSLTEAESVRSEAACSCPEIPSFSFAPLAPSSCDCSETVKVAIPMVQWKRTLVSFLARHE
jgi:hypothetical protein